MAIGALFSVAFGLTDFLLQGNNGLIASLLFGSAFFFFRVYSYIGVALVVGGAIAEVSLGIHPTIGGFGVAVLIFISSALGRRLWSLMFLAAAVLTGAAIAWQTIFNTSAAQALFGIRVYNADGNTWIYLLAVISIIGVNGFAWLLGGFLIELYRERLASRERDLVQGHNLRTMLEISEQNQRFLIASDINEAALERVSALLTLTDGARYASKLDPSIAARTLDRLVDLLRDTHDEMRRLYDMLNQSVQVAAAPPNLNDLNLLMIQLRQEGYQASLNHQGQRVPLIPSAELALYRIAFDAVENIRQHAPQGSAIDVTFIWSGDGVQLLVKDNGLELAANAVGELNLSLEETVAEEVDALTQEVTGPGITGMRERAGLFQGTVEAHRVPGIGFTVNAMFPSILEYQADSEN